MAHNRHLGEKPVPLLKQMAGVANTFPTFRATPPRGGLLEMEGTLQPSPCSAVYRLRLVKQAGKVPQIWVVEPELHPDAPHLHEDRSLCLYFHEDWLWRESQLISRTILPWAALWLGFYELWLDTGIWYGPEAPHAAPEEKSA